MSQEPLRGMPASSHDGLFARVVRGDEIDHAAWLHIRAEGGFVGICRRCHDYLVPFAPYEHAGRTDYEAACRNGACRFTMLAPGGRVQHGSTLASRRPRGTT